MVNIVKGSIWFGDIGIVKVWNDIFMDTKFYIGLGSGVDRKADEEHLAVRGLPLDPQKVMEFLS